MPSGYRIALAPLRRIFADWWRGGRLSVLVLALSIPAAALLSVAAPYVFSRLIDDLPAEPARWLAAFSFYAALIALAGGLQRGTQYLAMIHAEKLSFIASTRFFERLIRKRPSFFTDHNPVEIQSAASQGARTALSLMHIAFNFFLPAFATVLFATATLGAVISVEIIVVVVLYGTLFLALTLAANRVTTRWLETAIEAGQENARFIGNAIGMIEPLRHSGSDRWMRERFAESAGAVFRNWRAYSLRRIGFVAILSLGLALQFIVTYWMLLPRYAAGEISVGDLVLFNMLLLQLNSPFEMIAQAVTETVRGLASFAPFARMWAAPEEEESRGPQPLRLARGVIEFDDVGYRYENGRGVEGVSLRAGPGRITFITGETGSGKSTLFKLLQKTMPPQRGRIAVDGRDLSAIGRDEWFSAVGIVPQEIMLLNDSLRVNIVLGRAFDPERLRRAAERAAILERIEAMPEGFETVVGERGLKLSGGERQRIAIARALYADPAILLLDEASSALDEATEREIMEQLRGVDREMTIIAITHRQSSIREGDRVVRLPPP